MSDAIDTISVGVSYAFVLAWIALSFKYGGGPVGTLAATTCATCWVLGYRRGRR